MSKLSKVWYQSKQPLLWSFTLGKFVFCRLTNKNVLEWFLLIWHTLSRSTNLLSRNHSTLCFWLIRGGWQMPNTKKLLYQTEKSSHRWFSIKMLFLKIFAIFTGKRPCEIFKNTSLRTSAYGCFWTGFTKYCLELCFWIPFKTIST